MGEESHMAESPSWCRYPNDADGFRRGLITALQKGTFVGHCVMEGLQAGCRLCFDAIVDGIRSVRSDGPEGELKAACEAALLEGYRRGIKAAGQLFVEGYRRLVLYAAYKSGLTDHGEPSADDIFQDVFRGLHARLQKNADVKPGHLAGYVWMSVVHACRRARRPEAVAMDSIDETGVERIWPQPEPEDGLTPAVIELWEELDQDLAKSDQGDLINRIILAHKCVDGCRAGQKFPAKKTLEAWRRAAEASETEIAEFCGRAGARPPSEGTVSFVADCFNAGTSEHWQIPIAFAVGSGLNGNDLRQLLEKMTKLSEGAIYARISHIYRALGVTTAKKTQKAQEQGHGR